MAATPLGDARPNPAGQWLKALRGFEGTRLWWAATDAAEEYEDALLEAFAAAVPAAATAALPDASLVLPFANRRRPGGRLRARRESTGSTRRAGVAAAPAASASAGGAAARQPAGARRDLSEAELAPLNDLLQRLACGEPEPPDHAVPGQRRGRRPAPARRGPGAAPERPRPAAARREDRGRPPGPRRPLGDPLRAAGRLRRAGSRESRTPGRPTPPRGPKSG